MDYKRLIAILMVGILLFTGAVSCSGNPSSGGGGGGGSEFEVIRQAADAYLSTGKADKTMKGIEIWNLLTDDDKSNDPHVLSVRLNATYRIGHICTAVNVPFRTLFLPTMFAGIPPKDKQLLVYSYTGNEGGGQATAILNMLGWDAINLQWGMTCWLVCPNTAPGIFRPSTNGGVAMDYGTETTVNTPTKTYDFPNVNNTSSNDPAEIIKAAADKYIRTELPLPSNYIGTSVFFKDTDITPKDLYTLLVDSDPKNDPFILDVRSPEYYAKGHIPGAVNIPITEVAKPENLHKLPPSWKEYTAGSVVTSSIVVVSSDGMAGSQVAGILSCLGYDAANLLFGMTAWTRNEDIAPGRFVEYKPGTDKHQDVLDLSFCFNNQPGRYDGPNAIQDVGAEGAAE
jgi:rhodanese-related sulfurtransferase